MISPLLAVVSFVSLGVAAPHASHASDAPERLVPLEAQSIGPSASVALGRVTLRDAPVSQTAAFAASAATGATGMVSLISLVAGPPVGLPGTLFSRHARVATGLLLMSVGPSMGDLLTGDVGGFLLGAGGRVALAALGYGTVMAMQGQWQMAPLAVMGGVLLTGFLGLAWTGWALADLARSAFAPQRWVERHNRSLRTTPAAPPPSSRHPPAAVPGEPGLFRM